MPFPYKKNVFTSANLCIWSWGDAALECPQSNTGFITTQALSLMVAACIRADGVAVFVSIPGPAVVRRPMGSLGSPYIQKNLAAGAQPD